MKRICLACGKETEKDKCICSSCRENEDIELLCEKIIRYRPCQEDNPNKNPVWETAASFLDENERFRQYAFILADELPSPRKEYQKIHALAGEFPNIARADKEQFFMLYDSLNMESLTMTEQLRIKGLKLEALYMDYNYSEAEILASEIINGENLPWQCIGILVDFYSKTRRYDVCQQLLNDGITKYADKTAAVRFLDKIAQANDKYKYAYENGGKEYMPCPRENRDSAIENYTKFMSSIGMDIKMQIKVPKPISKESYPSPNIITEINFDSFVAFDFETTGLSTALDSIIEVGAVKVVNNEIVESKEFIFSEYVKPYGKKLSKAVSDLTGITDNDLKNARQMWEVIPDFLKFAGDNVLVGFNNTTFDTLFLERAGRYSKLTIDNPQFDVLKYARKIKKEIGYDRDSMKLCALAQFCGVENPAAHRAWADAVTTAKIFLKLKEMVNRN